MGGMKAAATLNDGDTKMTRKQPKDRPAGAANPCIRDALDAFLEAQRQRLKPATMRKYEGAISLLAHYINDYGTDDLTGEQKALWERATDRGLRESPGVCDLVGPDHIPGHLHMFLNYFIVRKVMCGADFKRTAGTVAKKLGNWLYEQGYIDALTAADTIETGGQATQQLPATHRLLDMLAQHADEMFADSENVIEDYFEISRIERGRLHLIGLVTSDEIKLALPTALTDQCREGWTIAGAIAPKGRGWRLVDVWNVYL